MQKRFLTRKNAAQYLTEQRGLPTTYSTFQKFACLGGGPIYRIFGNEPVYTDQRLGQLRGVQTIGSAAVDF